MREELNSQPVAVDKYGRQRDGLKNCINETNDRFALACVPLRKTRRMAELSPICEFGFLAARARNTDFSAHAHF